jgi:hypothetical protein
MFSGTFLLVALVWTVAIIAGLWKMFEKAGEPGWAAIVPFYNIYVMLKIAGRPAWWLILFFVPFVSIIFAIIVAIDLAKVFGQSAVFGVVLNFLLMGIGYLILGFGDARYQRPMAMAARV